MRTTQLLALSLSLLTTVVPMSSAAAQDGSLLIVIQEPAVAGPTVAVPTVAAPAAAYAAEPGPQPLVVSRERGRGSRRDWALIGAGAGMALGGWALNVVGSLFWVLWPGSWGNDNTPYLAWSTVPVVGPLVQLTTESSEEWQAPIAVIVSAVQLAGWVMAIAGTASPTEDAPDVSVLPVVSDGYAGISAGGRF